MFIANREKKVTQSLWKIFPLLVLSGIKEDKQTQLLLTFVLLGCGGREGRNIDIKWYTDDTCVPRLAMDCSLGILSLHPGSDGYGYLQ